MTRRTTTTSAGSRRAPPRGIYTFNTVTNSWTKVTETEVAIGKGYWVYSNEAGRLVP